MRQFSRLWSVVALAAALFVSPSAAQEPAAPPESPPVAAPPEPPAEAPRPTTTPLAHVEVRGTGPVAMILIPGLLADWHAFESFMDRNAERYTMYAVTLPGFGGSEPPPEPEGSPYSEGAWLENAERAVLEMIAERKIEKPVVMGQSMGGHVALRLATGSPETFRAAIILHATPAYPLEGPGRTVDPKDRQDYANVWAHKLIEGTPDEEWYKQQRDYILQAVTDPARASALAEQSLKVPKSVSKRYMLEFVGADITSDLPKADLPLLVIAAIPALQGGDLSEVRRMWPAMYAGAPKATVVLFEDTRELILEDAPADLDRAIAQFLAGEKVEGKPKPAAQVEPRPQPDSPPEAVTPPSTPEQPPSPPDQPAPTTHPPPGQEGGR